MVAGAVGAREPLLQAGHCLGSVRNPSARAHGFALASKALTRERSMPSSNLSLSLVLGAGGARGLAHIGVIEELIARGYRIVSIAGSSMGALVGGIYAAGKLEEYRDWVIKLQRLDVLRLLDFTWRGGGMIRGERVIGVLRELVGEHQIESLPVSYTAVAVDIDAEREVWLSRGSLFSAIRASIAIPGIFTPLELHGRRLVDGGLLNPVPVAPTLRDLSDLTVVVNVNAVNGQILPSSASRAPEAGEEDANDDASIGWWGRIRRGRRLRRQSTMELLARSLDLMMQSITRHRLAGHHPHLLIEVSRDAASFYEFWRAQELIELGRRCAVQALDRLAAQR
ncbi:MAG: serine protease [Lysobacterales bacterium]|nr:MAG: serine protease [Xanthomonadales bacterium]